MNPSQFSMEVKRISTWRRHSKKRNHTPYPKVGSTGNAQIRRDLKKDISNSNRIADWVHGYSEWRKDSDGNHYLLEIEGHPSGTWKYRYEVHRETMKKFNIRCRCK